MLLMCLVGLSDVSATDDSPTLAKKIRRSRKSFPSVWVG
jgi:hypothetical protein